MTATYRISEWISIPSIADGHWKGPGSGRVKKFPGFLVAWKVSTDSLSVKALKDQKYQLLLAKNLYGSEPQGALPDIARVPLNKRRDRPDIGCDQRGILPAGPQLLRQGQPRGRERPAGLH